MPTQAERFEILKIHLGSRNQSFPVESVHALAAMTAEYSGAELEQAIIDGMFRSFSENRKLESTDVEDAIKATVPLAKTMADDIASLRAWAKTRARPASGLSEAPAQFAGRRRPVMVKE